MDESSKKVTFSISTGTVIKTLLIIGAAAMVLYLVDVVLILLTAIVIASAIEPGIRWFVRHRVPRVLATLIIYAVLTALIVILFYFIVPVFINDLANFMIMLPEKITNLDVKTSILGSDFLSWQSAVSGLTKGQSLGQVVQNLMSTLANASESILSLLTTVFGGVTSFIFIVVLSFYFAVREGGIEDFLRLITPLKHEEYIINLWHRTQYKIGRWIQGQLILAVIVGVLVYIGLRILNIPNALFLALISGVFEIIPIFGPFIGAVPGVLVGFFQGGFTFGIIVALMYIIVQQVESNIIYPLVVKKILDVPPLVVIIALIIGGKLGGLLGVILSVPAAAAFMEYMSDVGKYRTVARAKMSGDNH